MVIEKDGLEDYTLGKDYGTYESGSVIRVDADRKRWLDENGYGVVPVTTPALAEPPVIRRRRSPPAELETPPNIPDLPIRET